MQAGGLPNTFVPGRNLLFLTLAAALAYRRKLAKVSAQVATATALAKVPGGAVRSGEIEKEGGKTIYTFIIKVAGKRGVEEVNVDAMTGAVVAVEHEADPEEAKVTKPKAKVPPSPTGAASDV